MTYLTILMRIYLLLYFFLNFYLNFFLPASSIFSCTTYSLLKQDNFSRSDLAFLKWFCTRMLTVLPFFIRVNLTHYLFFLSLNFAEPYEISKYVSFLPLELYFLKYFLLISVELMMLHHKFLKIKTLLHFSPHLLQILLVLFEAVIFSYAEGQLFVERRKSH